MINHVFFDFFFCTVSSEVRLCFFVHKEAVRYWDGESKNKKDDDEGRYMATATGVYVWHMTWKSLTRGYTVLVDNAYGRQ